MPIYTERLRLTEKDLLNHGTGSGAVTTTTVKTNDFAGKN